MKLLYFGKSIGQNTIDPRVETILEDNAEMLRDDGAFEGHPCIKDVVWTEIVQVVGSKTFVPEQIIGELLQSAGHGPTSRHSTINSRYHN